MAVVCSLSTVMNRFLVLDTIKKPLTLEEKPQHVSEMTIPAQKTVQAGMTIPAENLTLFVKAEDPSKVL